MSDFIIATAAAPAALPAIKIGQRTFTLLFPELLRPLTDSEREALKDSIEKDGVRTPVIIDEEDQVIDGGNRVRIAAELGLPDIPVSVEYGLTHEEKVELALVLNQARRHLSPEEQQRAREKRVELVADLRRQGESLPSIAERTGVSVGQVQRDLEKAATLTGDKVQPESGTVKGRDGKTRRATRKRTTPAESKEITRQPEIISDEEPLAVEPVGAQGDLFSEESQAPEAVPRRRRGC